VLGNPNWVTLAGDRYRIDPAAIEEFDVAVFEREAESARRALVRGGGAVDVATLERALAHYRGDFLDGEPVGDWHLEHRDRLQRLYVDALMELGGRYVEEERHAKAADVFRRVLARDDLHEEALRALMRSLAEAGERSQALRAYRHFAARLREELEAEPEEETLQLSEQLQASAS
jgi:DNA-binding SARP family transcriptional activator